MDSDFGKYLSSDQFTFIVGQARREIVVHSAPLASLSPTLDKLINGTMLEAKLRQVDWSGVVEEDTFVRLCEFAYVGDYTPPSCSKREARLQTPVSEQHAEDDWSAFAKSSKKIKIKAVEEMAQPCYPFQGQILPHLKKNIQISHFQDTFTSLNMQFTQSYGNSLSEHKAKFAPLKNFHPREDFSPVFLGHAKLYILADTYGIMPLVDQVLYKLGATLAHFRLCEDNVNDVVELVRCSYQGTRPRDALRTLVTTYVLSVLGQIGESNCFQGLLAEGGDFVLDFWQMIWG